ncbi:MAG: hypothetical protein FJY17_00740 [Bacteroidetes bacterium]|nr:hypothetical protein [Bacteroidota bacterium]
MNLKLHEVISLYYELNGVTKQGQETEVLSQGMLKQKMSLKTKVYLQRLNKIVNEEVKLYEETKQELWKKWGNEKDGMIEIPSENVAEFNRELQDLLTAEKEISVSELWGADLKLAQLESIETDEFYPVLFALIDSK